LTYRINILEDLDVDRLQLIEKNEIYSV